MRYITLLFVFLMIATAADRELAGRYAGEWKSNSAGNGGAFRLNLEQPANGAWKLDVVFTYAGEDVKTITHEVKVNQSKSEAAYDFDLMGATLRSKVTGERKGSGFEGRYQTTTVDGANAVDDGVWTATRKEAAATRSSFTPATHTGSTPAAQDWGSAPVLAQ